MSEANLEERERKLIERERKLNERERGLNEERAKLNILNGKFSIKALELKDRTEAIEQKESEYEKKNAKLEENITLLNQKKAELESNFLSREISIKEREEGLLKQEQDQELELKKKGLELKTAQEAELARERIQAMESVHEQLEKQRMEFEAAITQYEQNRRKEAEQSAEKIRADAKEDAKKIRSNAEAEVAEKNRQREEEVAAYEKRKSELKEQIAKLEKEIAKLKEDSEAELARERAKEMQSLEEHLTEQRAEFEAMLTQYEQERRQEAETEAETIQSKAKAEAEKLRTEAEVEAEKLRSEAKKVQTEAEAQAEKIWNDAQEGSQRLRSRAETKAAEEALEYERKCDELKEQLKELERQKKQKESSLLAREVLLKEREEKLDEREKNQELDLKKKGLELKAVQEIELAQERNQAVEALGVQLSKRREEAEAAASQYEEEERRAAKLQASKIRSEAEKEAEKKLKEAAEAQERADELEKGNIEKKKELDEKEEELTRREDELSVGLRKNEREKRRLQLKQEELENQESDLKKLVSDAMADREANFRTQLEAKERALQELREKVKYLTQEQDAVEKFKVSIGENPAIIENEILHLQRTVTELKEELSRMVPAEIQKERDDLKKEYEDQTAEIAELEKENRLLIKKNGELASLETMNISLESKNEELASLVRELRSQNDTYKVRIERMSSSEPKLADREQRIAQINKGIPLPLIGADMPMKLSELAWLENIYNQCDQYGIHFPQRILYAFHTALKIADWSSITVLAGVSGTGKSELPKLYAAFGGFNFINVPVQPSWDSQESMLGFFNSIDNRFEPEPLLRFLVQCTEDVDYSKYMSIVLLDEMNLAHVEYYFADFLSKLETRRGTSKRTVPSVELKLGAGVEPYQLRLERSILWTGTMNQDETTKSLSDKVLDRGLVINFPRPSKFRSRKAMGILDKAVRETNRPMLSKNQWGKWIVQEAALQGDQEKELHLYRSIVEDINGEMEHVGRALGHRVWQSIEYYILNYPTVTEEQQKLASGEMSGALRESMKIAFEDQIVQKIMPKLRGVETRGKGREHLDKIEAMLEDKGFERLKDDFEIACEQGYGQFIWNSAKYIEADEALKKEA